MNYLQEAKTFLLENFPSYGILKPLTWVKVGSDVIRWGVPSLGVLVGDTLLPVGQVPVVPVQVPTVKLGTPIPHIVEGVDTVVGRFQVGNIIQGDTSATLLSMRRVFGVR